MGDSSSLEHELRSLVGEEIVVDVRHSHLFVGTLTKIGRDTVVLKDADVHFCGDSQTTTELYLVETKKNGVRPNRSAVYIMRSEVVSISRLSDIIEY